MNDEETAAIFIKRYWGTYTEAFRQETIPRLVKLIQDEREACAKILQDEIDTWNRIEIGSSDVAVAALTGALEKIRARSK